MPVEAVIFEHLVSFRLLKRASVSASRLMLMPDAAVEILVPACVSPELGDAGRQEVIHGLRDRAMEPLHHLWEVLTGAKIAQRVIMIAHERCNPRGEGELVGIAVEAVPEDSLRFLGRERVLMICTWAVMK